MEQCGYGRQWAGPLRALDRVGDGEWKFGAVAWSLYASADGSTLFLSGQGGQGVADFLEAKISFEAGRWYLLALNYSAKATALYVNAELVAEGTGLAAVNPASAGLVVGSDGAGGNLAGGLFDEVTTFGEPVAPELQAFYYNGVSGQAARGPVSAEEEAAELAAAAQRLAEQEAAAMMNFAWSEAANPCITNGPVFLTNIGCVNLEGQGWTATFTIAGGTNGIPYDIYSTTNLVGNNITNSQWVWLDQGYTCNTDTFTNQPATNAFYVLGLTNDTDHDGLSDAFVEIALRAREREVVRIVRAAVLPGDDVFDVETQSGELLWQPAEFTAVASALADQLPGGRIHQAG